VSTKKARGHPPICPIHFCLSFEDLNGLP
jgi:hypothetical protein